MWTSACERSLGFLLKQKPPEKNRKKAFKFQSGGESGKTRTGCPVIKEPNQRLKKNSRSVPVGSVFNHECPLPFSSSSLHLCCADFLPFRLSLIQGQHLGLVTFHPGAVRRITDAKDAEELPATICVQAGREEEKRGKKLSERSRRWRLAHLFLKIHPTMASDGARDRTHQDKPKRWASAGEQSRPPSAGRLVPAPLAGC